MNKILIKSYFKYTSTLLILALLAALPVQQAFAKKHSRTEIQSAFIFQFLNHISWKNDSSETLNIAFYGKDKEYFNNIKTAVTGRKIRGKNINTTTINNLEDLHKFQVLVVAPKSHVSFDKIARKARNSNTLIISEAQKSPLHIMINFIHYHEKVSFEINKSNMLLEGITFSKDLLLLGGTQLEVAELFRQMEEGLSQLHDELIITQEKTDLAKSTLGNNKIQLSSTKSHLNKTQLILNTVNETLDSQKKTIINQRNTIKLHQSNLDRVTIQAKEKHELLEKQNHQIKQQAEEIFHQVNRYELNKQSLDKQKKDLALLQINSSQQLITIRDQRLLLIALLGLALLLMIMAFRIYLMSQDRKRLSLQLEKRGEYLTKAVKSTTAKAEESEIKYKTLAEFSPVGIFRTDINGNCLYVNERWCEYSGLSREQAMGKNWINAIHPDDRVLLGPKWGHDLNTQCLFNTEHRYLTPEGKLTWVIGQCVLEHDAFGQLQGFIGAVTDITDQRHIQEQLRRSQKMDALGKITGGIAHDYNNMLCVISGYTGLLALTLKGQTKALEYVGQISHASDRGATLTKKLLSFSTHDQFDAKLMNINTALEYQKEVLEQILTPRIQLHLHLEDCLWSNWIDSGDLEDALINISINAMHAMDGKGSLDIKTKNLSIPPIEASELQIDQGDYVLLSITDTGSGMNADTKEKLFDPFFSTKGAKGTGLGLTQVYSFVRRSNGVIKIDSTLGHGTKINMYFPRLKDPDESNTLQLDISAANNSGKETILVVDDKESLRLLACDILSRQGYLVHSASNGQKALEMLKDTKVHLLLSDIIMPDMDGYQLASAAQKLYPTIKIQLISGFTSESDEQDVNKSLSQNIIRKPYKPQQLLAQIRNLLDNNVVKTNKQTGELTD